MAILQQKLMRELGEARWYWVVVLFEIRIPNGFVRIAGIAGAELKVKYTRSVTFQDIRDNESAGLK
jgi:hypothetical protein